MMRKLPKRDDAIRLTQQQQQQQLSKLIIILGDDFCLFPHFQYCGWMNRDQRYQITMNRCLFQLVKCAMGARDGNRGTSLSVSWAFSWVLAAWWSINSSAERGARSYLLLCLLYCNLEPPAVCWEEEAHKEKVSWIIQSPRVVQPFKMQRHQRLCLLLNYILFLLLLSSTAVNGRQVVSFKKNLEQVMSKRMCKEPQQRLVYLGNPHFVLFNSR